MNINEFDFHLPNELIAQSPLEKRDQSRLLVIDKITGNMKHEHFFDITKYFKAGDVLVLNETKVIPARIYGIKEVTKANIEVLLLKEIDKNIWEALVKPAKRISVGDTITFSSTLKAKCIDIGSEGIRVFEMLYEGVFIEQLEKIGQMPLPPYITKLLEEKNRYQTVYAKELGSAAAPTAGLHFTTEILDELRNKGVIIVPITLHVGLGTFRPVSADNIENHVMHSESYYISNEAAKTLNTAYQNKAKIIAVGTTSVRTLESNFSDGFHAGSFNTSIFIYPGYKFKIVDEIITNFHLPKSSLIMLISAFSSKENIKRAYLEAVNMKYRFFSFGDAMFIRNFKEND